ncbi:MAG TPA: DUF4340 domain-containing protein [Terriglobia bacterium]|nr:DUF4340 domain-containing protein [Terriglobia bacterium]
MNKKYLNTLIALAVLAGLWGAFTYFGRKKSAKAAKSATAAGQKIFPVARGHITSFTFKPQDGEAVTCARQGSAWVITEPRKLATDSSTLDGFLKSLTSASASEVVAEHPVSLKDFGLDPPQETIEISTDQKPAKFTLLMGSSTPTNQGFYAQVGGHERVIMLASSLKDSLEKSLFDLRNKSVVTLESGQVDHLAATLKSGSYTLVKNPEGVWDLMLPPAVRADRFTVEGLVDELGSASMKSIVEESKKDLGKYGFSNPTLTLHLSGPGGRQTLVVGKKSGDQYYAMNTALDPVFTLGSDFLNQFQKSASDLRSKDLFTYSTFEVNKVVVDGPGGRRVFEQNKNNKWSETSPANKMEPGPKLETLIDNLRDLSATSFPKKNPTDLAAYGLIKPLYTFQVQSGKQNKTQTVEVAKAGGHIYARRSSDLVPAEVSEKALSAVEEALGAL